MIMIRWLAARLRSVLAFNASAPRRNPCRLVNTEQVEIGDFAMMVTLIMNDIAFNHQCVSSKEEGCKQVVILKISNDD